VNRFITTCLQTCNNLCVFTCVTCVTCVTTVFRTGKIHASKALPTHVKTRKLLQICKQVVTRLLCVRPSCCAKSGTSCYHLVTNNTKLMMVNRLATSCSSKINIQAVRNKLLRACCHQLVNNLLRADDIKLIGTTCCEPVGLINLVRRC
jgi:hypothetical protein